MRDLARYLDTVRSLYPGGIPHALLKSEQKLERPVEAASVLTWGNPKSKLSMVVVDSGLGVQLASPFEGKMGELLKGIIAQGLKLDAKRIYLVLSDSSHKDSAQFQEVLVKISSPYVVALGQDAASCFGTEFNFDEMRGKWTTLSDSKELLTTYALSEIAQDAALKKLFWADLKKVLLKLH